jgi:hypothetical protein
VQAQGRVELLDRAAGGIHVIRLERGQEAAQEGIKLPVLRYQLIDPYAFRRFRHEEIFPWRVSVADNGAMHGICRRVLLIAVALATTLSCRKSGDPIQECLDALVRSANARDADQFFQQVAADFGGADGSARADAEALLRRLFAGYENLDVTLRDVSIERAENAARVRLRADLSGQPRKLGGLDGFLPRTSSYDFDMRLAPDAGSGKWKVAWASWQPRGGG